jgi:WD40 repeat protein
MAESNDASNEAPLQELKITDGHNAGSVFAAWLAPKEGLAVLTAGADGVLAERQIRPTQKDLSRTQLDRECKHAKGIHCLDISPDRTKAAVAINRNNIQVRAANTSCWCISISCGRCTSHHPHHGKHSGIPDERCMARCCFTADAEAVFAHRTCLGPAMLKPRQPCLCCLLLQLVHLLGDAIDRNDMLTITKTKEPAHCCCWSKDGKYVLAAGDCGMVRLVEITEKKRAVRCT